MLDINTIIYVVGAIVCGLAGLVGVSALAYIFLRWWLGPYGPLLNLGKPKLRGELAFYSRPRILTKKDGGRYTEQEFAALPDKKDHWFNVPWFIGLSTRKGHFLLGLIRLERQP